MSNAPSRPIALVLNGEGARAMAFHLGVLKLLAERGEFDRVDRISTVGGGSLLIGLLMQECRLRWPSSDLFLNAVYPKLRERLSQRGLHGDALRRLWQPRNWRFAMSRANLLAQALRDDWQMSVRLAELPAKPDWSINATVAENGKRFRFKAIDIGDHTLGYAAPRQLLLADALAVAVARPGGFGPLLLKPRQFSWRKRPLGAGASGEQAIKLGFRTLHLYDGSVYDSLGLEPFFDAGRGQPKESTDLYFVVSDACSPRLPATGAAKGLFGVFKRRRAEDILLDQAHALRVRSFSAYLQRGDERGAVLSITTPIGTDRPCKSALFAAGFATTWKRLSGRNFDRLAEHGYRVASLMQARLF